jgi:PII-like signaling protein
MSLPVDLPVVVLQLEAEEEYHHVLDKGSDLISNLCLQWEQTANVGPIDFHYTTWSA